MSRPCLLLIALNFPDPFLIENLPLDWMSNGNKQALGHETAVIEDWLLLRTSSIGKKKRLIYVLILFGGERPHII